MIRNSTTIVFSVLCMISLAGCSDTSSNDQGIEGTGGVFPASGGNSGFSGGSSPVTGGISTASGGGSPVTGGIDTSSSGGGSPVAGGNGGFSGSVTIFDGGPTEDGATAGGGGSPDVDTGVGDTGGTGGVEIEADYSKLKDPGTGPWEKGTPEECKMDPTKFQDSRLGTYAVFRYGKLCHMKGLDSAGMMFSATKTLGGVMAGRGAYVAHEVQRTGPGTGPILHDDLGTDWIAMPSYPRRDAMITHIMSMVAAASPSLDDAALTFRYDTVGAEAINNMIAATEKCISQVPGMPTNAVAFVQQEIFDKLGMNSSSWPGGMIGTGWNANLSDMGKLGTLMLHDGWYNGERLLSQEWVYRMSHPAFESANTSYGQLAWLNHRGNAQGIGGDISSGSNSPDGDPCAPAAFWPKYPHPPSESTDCRATVAGASCVQQYDVGIYSAQGLGGQFVVMHPGLDMVLVAQNFSGGGGPMGMWAAVRPGVVAMDPKYNGDEEAFCKDYGAGNYAPDLFVPRFKP